MERFKIHKKQYWLDKQLPVICATSTRSGGVSSKPYESLNLAYHVNDDPNNVTDNRQRFCNELGIDVNTLVLARQVHGDNIEIVESKDAGRGAYSIEDAIPDTDAMITTSKSISIGILTADCVPVMIFDPVKSAIGAVHAGWKGTILMLPAKTILKMKESFGTDPSDCMVALGPSIGHCCYEVGEELITQFDKAFGAGKCTTGNKLDLPQAVKLQLVGVGVKKDNISSNSDCTACNLDLFYSHRAENGVTGRMMSLVRMKADG
jgi:YfiH family protein